MSFGPSQSYYDPPEPPLPCCPLGEDEPEHDTVACLARQAEDHADAMAERERDLEMWGDSW